MVVIGILREAGYCAQRLQSLTVLCETSSLSPPYAEGIKAIGDACGGQQAGLSRNSRCDFKRISSHKRKSGGFPRSRFLFLAFVVNRD